MRHTKGLLGLAVSLFAVAVLLPAAAGAIPVDGRLDPSYALMSTQAIQTNGSDDTQGVMDFGTGSELDAAYAAVENGVLYLFFAGNLKDTVCGGQACTDFGILDVFIDSQPGGQNPLISPAAVGFGFPYPGLAFDPGFAPDFWVQYSDYGGLDHVFGRQASYEALPTGGGGASYVLGSGSNAGAPGTLSGGTNPFGILATIDNRNTAGVGAGCGVASGAGVTSGMELAIPLAAIGNPTGCIKVTAFLGDPQTGQGILNQVLPPVPAGTCALGPPATVNFASIPGDQFMTICLGATPTRNPSWGALKTIYR
jgi:hypothetical protein